MNNKNYIGKMLYVKIDRPFGSKHPKHGFIYPVNYGYVPNTISGDGEELDCYICPTGELLELKTVDKQGYKIYKSDSKSCSICPLKNKCTKSKNNQKVITRHIWQDKKDEVNERRYGDLFKQEYPKRKETVERIFGDCKEQHGLRFTRVRGLEKNSNQALLIFACHNLKKIAIWHSKADKDNENIAQNNTKKSILVLISKIKRALLKNNTLLSTI